MACSSLETTVGRTQCSEEAVAGLLQEAAGRTDAECGECADTEEAVAELLQEAAGRTDTECGECADTECGECTDSEAPDDIKNLESIWVYHKCLQALERKNVEPGEDKAVTLPPEQFMEVAFVDEEQLENEIAKVKMKACERDFRKCDELDKLSSKRLGSRESATWVVNRIITYAEVVCLQEKATLHNKLDRKACMWVPIRGLKGFENFSRYRVPPQPTWPVGLRGEIGKKWKVIEVASNYQQVELRHADALTRITTDIACLADYESYDADDFLEACEKREDDLRRARVEKELPKRKSIVEQYLADSRYLECSAIPTPSPEETMDMSHSQWEKLKKAWRFAVLTGKPRCCTEDNVL
jgi:hypothetical protein